MERQLKEVDTKKYNIEESDRQKQLRIAKETKELEVKELNSNLVIAKKELPLLKEQLEKIRKTSN